MTKSKTRKAVTAPLPASFDGAAGTWPFRLDATTIAEVGTMVHDDIGDRIRGLTPNTRDRVLIRLLLLAGINAARDQPIDLATADRVMRELGEVRSIEVISQHARLDLAQAIH